MISIPCEMRIARAALARCNKRAAGHRRKELFTLASSTQAVAGEWLAIYNAAVRQFASRHGLKPAAVRRWIALNSREVSR